MPSYFRRGEEFAVNSFTFANQTAPSVATFPDGGFVVVWGTQDTAQDGDGSAIKAQLFDSAGNKTGPEFRVNGAGAGSQFTPSVTSLGYSGFVVTWTSNDTAQDGSGSAIKAQIFARDGSALGAEFLVNSQSASSQFNPVAAPLANGGFVIAWDDWNGFDTKAQLFDSGGGRVGGELRLNTNTAGSEETVDVTGLAGGGFVATWRTTDPGGDGSGDAVRAQIFSASGAKVGVEFLVNTLKAGSQNDASVTALADGGFVVTWYSADGSQDVKGQVFSASGAKVGGEFLVNGQTADIQREAVVAATADGGFVVAWTSYNSGQDGSSFAIKAQAFDAWGNKAGGEMLVNTLATGAQFISDIAAFADGRIVVTWASESGDGNGYAVRGQILAPNARPTIVSNGGGTSASVNVDEGQSLVTTVVATDDGPNPVRYSISGGSAASLFAIDSVTGELFFRQAPDYENPVEGSGNFYTVYVTADDGELASFQMIQVMVNNVYEDVRFAAPAISFSVDENGTEVGSVSARGEAGYELHYTILGGADGALFTIDGATGALSFRSAPDYEIAQDMGWDNVYNVTVAVSDGVTSAVQSVSVVVGNVDEGVSFFSYGGAATVQLTHGELVYWVGQVEAFAESGAVTYSIAGGADAALFAVDPATGELTFLYEARPDFEAPTDADGDQVYEVTVAASAGASSATQAFAVTIENWNEGIYVTSNGGGSSAAIAVAENDRSVTTVTAYDPDGTTPTFLITGGADAARFTIDAQTGVLSFIDAPDYETPGDADGDNVYLVSIAASDGEYATGQDLAVTVANRDEAVDFVSYSGADIAVLWTDENGDGAVALAQAVDRDGGPVTYAISGGADAALFTIDAATGALSFIVSPDFEFPTDSDGDNAYAVVVTASAGGSSDWQGYELLVRNVNEKVVITSDGGGATASVEARENGVAVTTVVAEDYDETFPTFAIVGGADADRFTIDSATGVLRFVSAPDREAPGDADGDNVYDVVVRATDGSLFDDQAIAVVVANVDEGLAITSYGGEDTVFLTLNENKTDAATLAAKDVEDDPVTYAIVGGADAAKFQVNAATGALSFIAAPDFEAPTDANADNVYKVEVAAYAGAFSDVQVFAIKIGNVNEPVAITSNGGASNASLSVSENSRTVTTVFAADPDGAAITYSIVGGTDASRFTINPATGLLEFVTAPDFEAPRDSNGDNVYLVDVQASDGSSVDQQSLVIIVADVRDGAVINGTSGNDTISGTSTNPALRTTNGEDMVLAGGGHDTILGLGGGDVLNGEAGNDSINGGAGADRLTGGLGKDEFVFTAVGDSTPGARDVITDFSRSQGDRILLSGIDANSFAAGDQAFSFIGAAAFSGVAGQLRFEQVGGNTLVSGDVNGDRVADFQIELSGTLTPVASDFVL